MSGSNVTTNIIIRGRVRVTEEMIMEAEVRGRQTQAKKHLGTPEVGRSQEGTLFLSHSLTRERGAVDTLISDLWPRGL